MGRRTHPRRVTPTCTTTKTSTLSVLASRGFFKKGLGSVHTTHPLMSVPVLEGSFVVSRCRLCRTGVINTSTMLLVTTTLGPRGYGRLIGGTRSLNLRMLLRVRDSRRLACVGRGVSVIKVGGQGLKAFFASIRGSFQLTKRLPRSTMLMSRDKVSSPRAMGHLRATKFQKFLVKRAFVEAARPKGALKGFLRNVRWVGCSGRGVCNRQGGRRDVQCTQDQGRAKSEVTPECECTKVCLLSRVSPMYL